MSPAGTAGGATRARHATPDADPRIVERRRRVEGERRRRVRRRWLAVLAVASVIGALVGLAYSPLLDTEAVLVAGVDDPARAEAVVGATGVGTGDPLVLVDTAGVARQVAALPWVDTASVERSWPGGTVTVTVTSRVPAAALPGPEGRWWLVDVTGQVIAGSPDAAGVPVLGGGGERGLGERLDAVDRALVDVAAALTPGLASRVAEVRPGAGGAAELALAGGGVVVLGQPADLATEVLEVKLRTLRTVLATVDLNCVERIDVQVSDTAVLTRNPSCA